MRPKIPHVKPGDHVAAPDFNEIAARLERFLNLRVAENSGLTLDSGPYGHIIGLTQPGPIWAQLSGSSSPYSFTEVSRTSSNTWATFGNLSGTSNAYEINNTANLGGKVVELWRTAAGDWRFAAECATCSITWSFHVTGCNSANISGAVVVLKQSGVTIATCTTNTSGVCSMTVPPGTYDVTITPPTSSYYDTYTNTLAATTNTNVTLSQSTSQCQSTCTTCSVIPNSLSVTGQWVVGGPTVSDTLLWGAPVAPGYTGGTNGWFGQTQVNDQGGNPGYLGLSCFVAGGGGSPCSSGALCLVFRATTDPNPLDFGGAKLTFMRGTCSPFSLVGTAGGGGSWTLIG